MTNIRIVTVKFFLLSMKESLDSVHFDITSNPAVSVSRNLVEKKVVVAVASIEIQ